MQSLAVPIVAFACLLASVAAGAGGRMHGVRWPILDSAPAAMRALAIAVMAMAFAGLGVLTYNTWLEFRQAETQMARFVGDVAALDAALRASGEAGAPARLALFEYAESMSRQLYVRRGDFVASAPQTLEAARLRLGEAVVGAPLSGAVVGAPLSGAGALAAGRFETLSRSGTGLLAIVPPVGVKLCRPILVAWMMAGLGLMALLVGPQARTAIALVAVAGLLALGVFYLEELASPFTGRVIVSPTALDDVLHAISE